jgi:hypothetical protein
MHVCGGLKDDLMPYLRSCAVQLAQHVNSLQYGCTLGHASLHEAKILFHLWTYAQEVIRYI